MKTVLVIEDDQKISSQLQSRLSATGYRVVSAADAVYGVTEAMSKQPDVTVLDVNLAGGDGLLVAEHLRHEPETTDIPLIFISGGEKSSDRERAGELSAAGYLEKPFSSADLIEAIQNAIDHLPDQQFIA